MQQLTVALVANPSGRGSEPTEHGDSGDAAAAITFALETLGTRVLHLPWKGQAGELRARVARCRHELHLVFNGLTGLPSRQALVPALLEEMEIPYTGTRSRAMSAAVDKHASRCRLDGLGVRQPPYQLFAHARQRLRRDLAFPLIVKPARGGGSEGITADSVVFDRPELESVVGRLLNAYGYPVLVETYLEGREYTVGIAGGLVLPPLEFDLARMPGAPVVRDPLVKETDVEFARITGVSDPVYRDVMQQALITHHALELGDYSRVDFRADRDGTAYLLEVNPLPGLHPKHSDLPTEADAAGLDYVELIALIVASALRRGRAAGACGFDSRVVLELEAVAREASGRIGTTGGGRPRSHGPVPAAQLSSGAVRGRW